MTPSCSLFYCDCRNLEALVQLSTVHAQNASVYHSRNPTRQGFALCFRVSKHLLFKDGVALRPTVLLPLALDSFSFASSRLPHYVSRKSELGSPLAGAAEFKMAAEECAAPIGRRSMLLRPAACPACWQQAGCGLVATDWRDWPGRFAVGHVGHQGAA